MVASGNFLGLADWCLSQTVNLLSFEVGDDPSWQCYCRSFAERWCCVICKRKPLHAFSLAGLAAAASLICAVPNEILADLVCQIWFTGALQRGYAWGIVFFCFTFSDFLIKHRYYCIGVYYKENKHSNAYNRRDTCICCFLK